VEPPRDRGDDSAEPSAHWRNSKGPQLKDTDRLFWVLYSRVADGWQKAVLIAQPRTILDWQKNRFKK
jgi:hypothetical protein